jgi:hypothetical protein
MLTCREKTRDIMAERLYKYPMGMGIMRIKQSLSSKRLWFLNFFIKDSFSIGVACLKRKSLLRPCSLVTLFTKTTKTIETIFDGKWRENNEKT